MARGSGRYTAFMEGRKRHLLGSLTGTLVEIGSGTGTNFRYFPPDLRVVGVEPNPFMHPYFREEARSSSRSADLVRASAESLPFKDETVDAVLSTLVLCSVKELQGVLREIIRVLRPGGRFLFVEHVAAPEGTRLRRIQRLVRPVWSRIGDGCQPDRETGESLLAAGFSEVSLDRFSVPLPLVSPHISGVALK
jgi:ubiquinone/menaquinone biosynthesis C-methylase UbiE